MSNRDGRGCETLAHAPEVAHALILYGGWWCQGVVGGCPNQWDVWGLWLAIIRPWMAADHPRSCINMTVEPAIMPRRKRKLTLTSRCQKRLKITRFPCVVCKEEVKDDQAALLCDGCERWQHLECNSGSTLGIIVIRPRVHTDTHTHICVCVCMCPTKNEDVYL